MTPTEPDADDAALTPDQVLAPGEPAFTEEDKQALLSLLEQFEHEDYANRLSDVRTVRKAREFWKGNQYEWWDEMQGRFQTLSLNLGLSEEDAADAYQYVTNIYQAYGLTFMSVVSQTKLNARFFPQSPDSPEDQATADGASTVADHVQRINNMDEQQVKEAFYMWTDGLFGGYARSVSDAERFGVRRVEKMGLSEPKQITPDMVMCTCGWAQSLPDGALAAGTMLPPCPQCQRAMTDENIRHGETVQYPEVKGYDETANSQVVIDTVGKLEMRLPSYAEKLEQAPYLIYSTEQPKSKIEDIYPEMVGKLGGSDVGPTDNEERRTRLNLVTDGKGAATMTQSEDMLTFKRVWFRKWALNAVKDKARRENLKALFPEGVMFAAVGKSLCEARSESMDQHWKICRPLPGDGTSVPSVGGALISVQERYNTLSNIEVETHEHGIPTLFVDEQAINMKAWKDQGNQPGLTFPVRTRSGLAVQAQMFQTDPAPVSPQLVAHREELMGPVAQFLTGLFPALFGGGALGNDTAAGYAMQRDQAMGRIGIIWRAMKNYRAELMKIAVEVFMAANSGDKTVAVLNSLGIFDWKTVHLDQMTGGFFAYPEANEDFPMTWTQKRNTVQELMNSPLVNVLQTPANMDALGRTLGPIGLEFPGTDARKQQIAEISELLTAAPTVQMTQQALPSADPYAPAAIQMVPTPAPTVPIDKELDDHTTHMSTVQEWAASPEGRRARIENPQGFDNVKLHFMQHQAAAAEILAQQQAAQAAAAPQQPQDKPGTAAA